MNQVSRLRRENGRADIKCTFVSSVSLHSPSWTGLLCYALFIFLIPKTLTPPSPTQAPAHLQQSILLLISLRFCGAKANLSLSSCSYFKPCSSKSKARTPSRRPGDPNLLDSSLNFTQAKKSDRRHRHHHHSVYSPHTPSPETITTESLKLQLHEYLKLVSTIPISCYILSCLYSKKTQRNSQYLSQQIQI
jgi:hypothetical protein